MASSWTTRARFLAAAIIGAAVVGHRATAQERTDAEAASDLATEAPDFRHPDDEGWRIRFEPSVGYFAPSGDLGLPASVAPRSDPVTNLDDLNLDSPRLAPYGELFIGHEAWSLTLSGFGVGIENTAVGTFNDRIGDAVIRPGDNITTELDYATIGLRGGYRFFRWVSEFDEVGTPIVWTRADVLFGLRGHTVDIDTRVSPGTAAAGLGGSSLAFGPRVATPAIGAGRILTAGADETFIEPVAGFAVEFEYMQTFGIDFYMAAGGLPLGDRTSYSVDLAVGFHYRPIPTVGAMIGYRLLVLGLEAGNGADRFEWKGAVAGLYWGVRLDF